MKAVLALLFLIGLLLAWPARVNAHEFRPATLVLNEVERGRFVVDWSQPVLSYEFDAKGLPVFPSQCHYEQTTLTCGADGLVGEVRFPMLEGTTQRVFVRVRWASGSEETLVVRGGESAHLDGGGHSRSNAGVMKQYVELGIEHILLGVDHLLFVLGLMLLVRERRRLVITITAFTLAHSFTLALATLGFVTVPQAPVEAAIALSILLLAAECADVRPSLTRRYPWLVAFAFGLLHGFGFAGALSEAGLPGDQVPLALLFFNVGVELGQIAVVLVAWVGALLALRWHRGFERLTKPLVYAMGTAAAYWAIERISITLGLSLA